ncbi:hypothetical protein [Flavobacterium crassostreae]|uniref:Uncharacterized protein n=1 Tax=Flavobacterium crassostreae TaxID=1763534 RepID=A0A1B9DJA0_9FLAO|nr:hypothetical protein [Flavobacterium crassostreae]OCB69770.1 hypothetical protein LPBF_12485 [Flavobacterium crassostreae]
MLNELQQQIKDLTEFDEIDLKVKHGDEIFPIIEKSTLFISYDYLLNDDSEYSFLNEEFYQKNSEFHNNRTDYQIYFEKVKTICSTKFNTVSKDTFNFKVVSLNKNLKEILKSVYDVSGLKAEQTPTFIEIILYTNKKSNRAPRVFGFIGNANVIYILFYDPFHKIFDATTPKNNNIL